MAFFDNFRLGNLFGGGDNSQSISPPPTDFDSSPFMQNLGGIESQPPQQGMFGPSFGGIESQPPSMGITPPINPNPADDPFGGYQTQTPYWSDIAQHLEDRPTREENEPGFWRKLGSVGAGIGGALLSGGNPMAGMHYGKMVWDKPYNDEMRDWQEEGQNLTDVAGVKDQGRQAINAALTQKREEDLEGFKAGTDRYEAETDRGTAISTSQRNEVLNEKDQWLMDEGNFEIVESGDSVYAMNPATQQAIPLTKIQGWMSPAQKEATEHANKVALEGVKEQRAIDADAREDVQAGTEHRYNLAETAAEGGSARNRTGPEMQARTAQQYTAIQDPELRKLFFTEMDNQGQVYLSPLDVIKTQYKNWYGKDIAATSPDLINHYNMIQQSIYGQQPFTLPQTNTLGATPPPSPIVNPPDEGGGFTAVQKRRP